MTRHPNSHTSRATDRDNAMTTMPATARDFTHPDVLTIGVREGWADPQTDATRIDWAPLQATAAIPFVVGGGRPVNPCEQTGIRYGRNQLGHWGEKLAADALVTATDQHGHRWIVMIERDDHHGWALPGGGVDPDESALDGAVRELREETGLRLTGVEWRITAPRYVPDPRASDEAWMVTVLATADLGSFVYGQFPAVFGADDAAQADWIPADSYDQVVDHLADHYGSQVFRAHQAMLAEMLAAAGSAR